VSVAITLMSSSLEPRHTQNQSFHLPFHLPYAATVVDLGSLEFGIWSLEFRLYYYLYLESFLSRLVSSLVHERSVHERGENHRA